MSEDPRTDIRRLLKRFGVQADEAVVRHLAQLPGPRPLRLRCTLEDRTDYGAAAPPAPLAVAVEGEVGGAG